MQSSGDVDRILERVFKPKRSTEFHREHKMQKWKSLNVLVNRQVREKTQRNYDELSLL
jgi:hypothetical protein